MVLAEEVLMTVKNGMWFQEGYQRNKRQVSSLHLQVGAQMLVPGMAGSPGLPGTAGKPTAPGSTDLRQEPLLPYWTPEKERSSPRDALPQRGWVGEPKLIYDTA